MTEDRLRFPGGSATDPSAQTRREPLSQSEALQPKVIQLQVRHAEQRARHAEIRLGDLEAERDAGLVRLKEVTRELEALRDQLNAVETSTSWRLASPLRKIGRDYPRLVKLLHQAVKAARGHQIENAITIETETTPPNKNLVDAIGECPREESAVASAPPAQRPQPAHQTVILIVDHSVPKPDHDAGSRAIMDVMLCLLEAGWRIHFWPQNGLWIEGYTQVLEVLGINVVDHRKADNIGLWLDNHSADLDHVLVSRATVANELAMPIISRCSGRLTYYGHDIGFIRLAMESEILNKATMLDEVARTRAFERRLWRLFDTVIYLSDEEAAVVRELEPATDARSIIPFSYEAFIERRIAPRSDTILFVAGFAHMPNVDAAEFLVYQVLPLIQEQYSTVKVALVGSNPDWAVSALAGPDVEVTGWVTEEELAERYQRSRVAVVPLRFGAGVKGKVVQALHQGLPVVVTPVGAQGIRDLERIAPVRQEPQEIAEAVLTLLQDDVAWMAQSVAQSQFAKGRYSRAAMRASLLRAFQPANALTTTDRSTGSNSTSTTD